MKSKAGIAFLVGLFIFCVAPASALAGSISGSLTDAETGAPVTDFTVCADPGPSGASWCVGVPASGEYKIGNLEAGEYRVSFRPYPGNNYVFQYWNGVFGYDDATLIPLAADEDKTGIDAAFEEGAEVSGTVVGEGDIGPIEEARVCARELAAPEIDQCTQTDADGTYVIAGLRDGAYELRFETPWSAVEFAPRYYDEKAFADETDELQLSSGDNITANAVLTPAGAIEGTVTGEGLPLEWAWACAYTLDQRKLGCTPTDEEGNYRYRGLPEGSYVLEFEAGSFKTEFSGNAPDFDSAIPVVVEVGATTGDVDADLAGPPGIKGTVLDAETGEPASGVVVCAIPQSIFLGVNCATTWEDGKYQIDGLEPDSYTVEFDDSRYARQYYDGATSESQATLVPVSGGMVAGIDAELLPGGSIAGHVTLAGAGTNLSSVKACALLADGSEAGCDNTNSSGIYEIEGLPVGDYRVRFTRSSYVTQYYNGKATLAEASTVAVAAGKTTGGIDAAMTKVEKPQNTALPELSGVGKVGENLSCSNGSWSNNPTKYEYYWYRNGQEISKAFASTYKLVSADAGKTIRCGVQGGNSAGWATTVAQSATTIQVAAIRQLSVTKSGAGSGTVTSNPAGIDCGTTCSMNANEGDSITLTATPALNSELTGWSGGGCSGAGECVVTLGAENASVTANFAPIAHTVSVAVTGAGSVSAASGAISGCTPSAGTCSGTYAQGSEVVLTATPDAHHAFTGWSGCTTASGTECKVTVDGAENVTATFAPITHQLSVTKAGAGSGTVTSNPAGIDCGTTCTAAFEEGASVTLTAAPASGSEFTGWSGGLCTGTGACTVTLDAAAAIVATFASKPIEGGGSVTPPATPATPAPAPPAAKPEPLKCKKGFKKKKVRGKVRCVKGKKKPQKKRS